MKKNFFNEIAMTIGSIIMAGFFFFIAKENIIAGMWLLISILWISNTIIVYKKISFNNRINDKTTSLYMNTFFDGCGEDNTLNNNYLVVPRSVLISMPNVWQRKMYLMLKKMNKTIFWPNNSLNYIVYVRDSKGRHKLDPYKQHANGTKRLPKRRSMKVGK